MRRNTVLFLGKFDSGDTLHEATRVAVLDAAAARGVLLNTRWMGPERLTLYPGMVAESAAVVLAPPAPGSSPSFPEQMIPALTVVREKGIPFLATGENHGLVFLEAARQLLGLQAVAGTSSDEPDQDPVVHRLPRTDEMLSDLHNVELEFDPDAPSPYGDTQRVNETTNIQHGLNPDYATRMVEAGFRVLARDRNDSRPYLHVLEEHPFHMTAAFLPQLQNSQAAPHPLIAGLVEACTAK